jgi:hypothetical protein
MVELKLFEKHRMLTRTSDLAGPQGKGPGAALHMHTRQLHQEPSNLEKEVPEFSKVGRGHSTKVLSHEHSILVCYA